MKNKEPPIDYRMGPRTGLIEPYVRDIALHTDIDAETVARVLERLDLPGQLDDGGSNRRFFDLPDLLEEAEGDRDSARVEIKELETQVEGLHSLFALLDSRLEFSGATSITDKLTMSLEEVKCLIADAEKIKIIKSVLADAQK